MAETLCYAVVFLFEALIAWLYFDRVFSEKRASQKTILTIFSLGYIVLFLLSRMENVVINGAASLLINSALLFGCYRTKFVPGLLHVGYMNIMMFGTELLVALVLSKFTADFSAYLYELEVTVAFCVLSRLIYFAVMQLTAKLFHQEPHGDPEYSLTLLSVFPVTSILIGFAICFVCVTAALSRPILLLLLLSIFLLLAGNIVVMLIYRRVEKLNAERLYYAVQTQKEASKAEYYEMMQEQTEKQRILVHDVKRHIHSISCLVEEQDYPALTEYINALNLTNAALDKRLSEEPVMNAILARYRTLCQDNSIDFDADVRSRTVSSMHKEDITALFDNLLSNAYEAAAKSTERYIILTVLREDEDAMLIKIANSCDTPPVKDPDGKYRTTKDTPLGHGVGLNSILNCVDRYAGQISMVYNQEEKTFTTVIIMKKTRREEKKVKKILDMK